VWLLVIYLYNAEPLSGPRFRWFISGLSITSLHGVGHQIVHPSEWPSPIKGIAQTLGRPLPTYLATEPHPVVPGRASSILQELHWQPSEPPQTADVTRKLHKEALGEADARINVGLGQEIGSVSTMFLVSSPFQYISPSFSC
jgi:hypothetical protein